MIRLANRNGAGDLGIEMVAVNAYERMHSREDQLHEPSLHPDAASIPLNPCVQLLSKSFQELLAYSNECMQTVNTLCAKINVTCILTAYRVNSKSANGH